MNMNLSSNLGRLRLIGLVEGLSLIFLVLIAVPIKYGFDLPQGVQWLGPIHGALFVLYVFAVISTSIEQRWSFGTVAKLFIACLIPFANFYIDSKILRPAIEAQSAPVGR